MKKKTEQVMAKDKNKLVFLNYLFWMQFVTNKTNIL